MSARPSLPRRLALALMRHATHILPAARAPWAEAMRHEVHHIDDGFEALAWAAGCVLASYVERSRAMSVLENGFTRALLTLFIGAEAASMLFASALTAAWRLHNDKAAAFLGAFTPGDDYHRFIPLMAATPWWLHAIWVGAAVLFLASAAEFLRKRVAAFPLFAAAGLLALLGNLISQSMAEYREAFSFPAPQLMRDYFIPAATALIPVLIAVALWAHSRCAPATPGRRNRV
jgi:hypothetical protein